MGKYNGAVITAAGQNLIAQAIAESKTVTFTTAQASSHAYPSSTDFEALTALTDVEKTVDINYAGVYSDTVVQVSARFDNTGVDTAYLINTLGFFAQLGTDTPILFAVSTAVTPDQMPVFDADNPSAFIYNMQMTVQNADSINLSVNPAGTVTVAQFDEIINIVETEIDAVSAKADSNEDAISDITNILGAKNLLKVSASSMTLSGVTFTVNSDMSISADGTATSEIFFPLSNQNFGDVRFGTDRLDDNSQYIFSGIEPNANFYMAYNPVNENKSNLVVKSGYTVDNVTIYPMIHPKHISNDTYVPYSKTNQELTGDVGDLSSLTTSDKSSLVNAVNEVDSHTDAAQSSANNAQQMIAPIQSTLVASKTYAIGEQFIYNGLLYEATAAIAQGGAITINGNCKLADCVTQQIKDKSNILSLQDVSYQGSDLTIDANSIKDFNITISREGYTYLGICGFVIGSSGNCSVVNCYRTSPTVARLRAFNPDNVANTFSNITLQILYVKS